MRSVTRISRHHLPITSKMKTNSVHTHGNQADEEQAARRLNREVVLEEISDMAEEDRGLAGLRGSRGANTAKPNHSGAYVVKLDSGLTVGLRFDSRNANWNDLKTGKQVGHNMDVFIPGTSPARVIAFTEPTSSDEIETLLLFGNLIGQKCRCGCGTIATHVMTGTECGKPHPPEPCCLTVGIYSEELASSIGEECVLRKFPSA